MRRSLTRSLAIRCSILAVLGLFAAVGEHFLRDGVELHYELDEIADQLAAATHSESGEPKLVPDISLEARLAVLPELRLAVVDQSGHLLFVYGSDPKALLATVAGAVDGYFELQSADGSRFGYIASRTTSDGTHLRIFAERGPAELRDRLIWVKAEILGEYGPFMLITSAVSILVVLVTVRRALRPLKRLSAEAAKIVPGHGKTLPVEQVPAEVVPLVTATNGALERLQEALARERRFTADIAHTLRTPLAAMRARVEALPEGADRTALMRALSRIERLVEQLLHKARLEAGALDEAVTFDLTALVRDIVADATPMVLRQGKSIVLNATEATTLRTGSPLAIERALLNLLDNAAKAAPLGTEIEVCVTADGTVLVRDRGPGFAKGETETLLEPYRRGAASRWQGAGLGLAIVAETVRRHGGETILRNRVGGGAEVGFRLPARSANQTANDRKLAA